MPGQPTTPLKRKVRVALIGCGAAARELQMPVLAGHEQVTVTALVDRDVARARKLADAYHVPRVLSDAQELDPSFVDAGIICTPPFHHAPCAMELARRGLHVLVEKPMATRYGDAVEMVRVAEQAGIVLAVSVFRRLFPSTRMLRAMVDSEFLGRPLSFDVEEGEVYSWPTATLGNMQRDLAGGGVLIDFGSHALDRLKFLFPGPASTLEYRDNAFGGVESDCVLKLRMTTADGAPIDGSLELSRTRNLRNSFRVHCERGTLELLSNDRFKVLVRPSGRPIVDPLTETKRVPVIDAAWDGEQESHWYEAFRAQIDDWVEAIATGRPAMLNGASVLPSFKLISDAYSRREALEEPWAPYAVRSVSGTPGVTRRRILITGATGFIGGRLAEVLSMRDGWQVRALVHNPSHASRLARLPVEMMMGDLDSPDDAARATEGCDAVVHCAIGTDWGNRKRIFDINVGGTTRLTQAALKHHVGRFVHVSTWAVHDLSQPIEISESTAANPPPGNDYAESKAVAERAVSDAVAQGLCAVTFRLTNVYGPFSTIFITRPVTHLAKGELVLLGDAEQIPSSTVHVDSVIETIVRALAAPADRVNGELFVISDGDDMSWADFYRYFAGALNTNVRMIPDQAPDAGVAENAGWLRWAATPLRSARDIARSPEMWALTKRVLKSEPVYGMGKWAMQSFPAVERAVKRSFDVDAPAVYRREPLTSSNDAFHFELTRTTPNIEKAKRVLGFEPAFPRERAMATTLDWLRYARIVPKGR